MQVILNVPNLSEYKTQNRGGVGQKVLEQRDQDFLEHILFVATNHQYLMFFTQKGNVLDAFMKFLKEQNK